MNTRPSATPRPTLLPSLVATERLETVDSAHDETCHSKEPSTDTESAGTPQPSCSCAEPVTKRRKTTYNTRKNELDELKHEAEILTRQLQKLQTRQRQRQLPLLNALATKAALQSHADEYRLLIAGMQSHTGFAYGSRQSEPPIGCFIHLSGDSGARQQTIEMMKEPKLEQARTYLLQRSRSMDLRSPCRQLENYVTREGHHVGLHFEITQFHCPVGGSLTAADVYEALLAFVRNQELEMTDTLGIVSVRESDERDDDMGAKQLRVLSVHGETLEVEKNIVQYTEFVERSELLDEPHGLFVVDYVDQDDEHPYRPEYRIRMDVASAKLVVQCPSEPSKPPAVALIQWGYLNFRSTPLASSAELEAMARDRLPSYYDAVVQTIYDQLAWRRRSKEPSVL